MTGEEQKPFVIEEAAASTLEAGAESVRAAIVISTDDLEPLRPEMMRETASAEPDSTTLSKPTPFVVRLAVFLFGMGLLGLATLSVGDWVLGLAARHWVLGLAAGTFVGATLLGALFWIWSEIRALGTLRSVIRSRERLERSRLPANPNVTKAYLEDAAEPLAAERNGLLRVEKWRRVAADAPSIQALECFEEIVLRPADAVAIMAIRKAAADAFGLVALSPTTITDTVVFAARAVTLIRSVAMAYGHHPGIGATWALLRRVGREAGNIAAADLVGNSFSELLSTHLDKIAVTAAEGAIAGQRMARLGILAMEVCRPVAFADGGRPKMKDILFGN